MKKTSLLLGILLCIVMIFSLVCCDDGDKEKNDVTPKQDKEETVPESSSENAPEKSDVQGAESNATPKEEDNRGAKLTTDTNLSKYLVRAASEKDGLYGYVDVRSGKYVIEPTFTFADIAFGDDGWACVSIDDFKTAINTSGEYLFKVGEIEDKVSYAGDCIVVKKGDKCYLYHGADYVCELKCEDETLNLRPTSAFAKGFGYNSMYDPDRYIVLGASKKGKSGFSYWLWFDKDGKFLYKAEEAGSFAGDETGYYHFADNKVTKIDSDGNVIEEIATKSSVHNVSYDGDNWYTMIDGTVYTNGFTPLNTKPKFYAHDAYNIIAGDGILKINDMYLDSSYSRFYSFHTDDYSYGFQNGYAKVDGGAPGAWGGDFNGYIDTQGNSVYEITDKENFDSYTSILPDGYFVFGNEDNLYGIKNLDGTTVVEPTYTSLYMRENGRHA